MLQLLILIFLSVVILLLYDRYCRPIRLLMKIPGPKRLPLLGNSYHFLLPRDELFTYIHSLYKTYGDLVQIHAINKQFVCLFNPDDIETILSSHRQVNKKEPYTFLKPWFGDGLFISNGKKWRQRRKMFIPSFYSNNLMEYSKTFTEQTNDFLKIVEAEVGKAETDIRPLISRPTLHITYETIMGSSMTVAFETMMEKYSRAIEITGESVITRICRPWLSFDVFFKWTSLAKKQKQALSDLRSLTDQIIIDRKEFLKNKNLIKEVEDDGSYGKKKRMERVLDLLLENENLGHVNMKSVREEVDTFMFAGHDTTSVALSYFIMAIANEPVIQEKIYEEMQSIFRNSQRSATIQDLNEMTYLECCIKESLRLYPSAPIIIRHVTEELTLSKSLDENLIKVVK